MISTLPTKSGGEGGGGDVDVDDVQDEEGFKGGKLE